MKKPHIILLKRINFSGLHNTMRNMIRKNKKEKTDNSLTENKIASELLNKFSNSDNDKKTAVIIGASSGIGYATATKLLENEYHVINISRNPCNLDRVANCLADVCKSNELEDVIEEIGAILFKIDVLIYSAGFSMAAPVEYAKQADIRYLFEVNYFGAIRAVQSALPFMKENGGRILLVSSIGGLLPIVYDSFYSSSKAALNMLAKSLSTELSQYGVRTTAVLPGGTATAFTSKRKVYEDSECREYSRSLNEAVESLANMEQNGMPASEVAKVILNCINAKNPPVQISCGLKNKFYNIAQRILPDKLSLYINENFYFS